MCLVPDREAKDGGLSFRHDKLFLSRERVSWACKSGGSSLVGGVHVGALSIVVVSLMVRLLSKRKKKG